MSVSVPILMPFLFLTHFSFQHPVRQRRRTARLLPSRFGIALADERTLNPMGTSVSQTCVLYD